MKKLLTLVFVLLLSVFAFASCDDADLGDFNADSFDVFNLFSPTVMQTDPEDLFDEGIDDIIDAKQYELKITSNTKYEVVGELTLVPKSEVPSNLSELMVIKETEDAIYLSGETELEAGLGATRIIAVSMSYVDGVLYINNDGAKQKTEVPSDKVEVAESVIFTTISAVTELLFDAYRPDGDNFNGVSVVKDGDLYKMEISFITEDDVEIVVETNQGNTKTLNMGEGDGKIVARFDADGNLKKYSLSLIAEEGGVRATLEYDVDCLVGKTEIKAPEDADSYKLVSADKLLK